jgi:hypothetical protein
MCSVALSQSETDVCVCVRACVCEQTALSGFMMGKQDIQIASVVISRDVNSNICF